MYIVRYCIAIVVFAGITARTHADLYVAQSGQIPDPVGGYASWSGAASNIQDAVSAATPNDSVWIGAGHYFAPTNGIAHNGVTNIVYIDKPLTIRSFTDSPADVILDGEGTNRAVAIVYSKTTADPFAIRGLTISNSWDHGISALQTPRTGGPIMWRNASSHMEHPETDTITGAATITE